MDPLQRFQEFSFTSLVIVSLLSMYNVSLLYCRDANFSAEIANQIKLLAKQNPSLSKNIEDTIYTDKNEIVMTDVNANTEEVEHAIDNRSEVPLNYKSELSDIIEDLKRSLVRKTGSMNLISNIKKSLQRKGSDTVTFNNKVIEGSNANADLQDNKHTDLSKKETLHVTDVSENAKVKETPYIKRDMNKIKRRLTDVDSCETERTEIDLRFTEHVSTDTSSYQLTCTGKVAVNKCEGLCNSSVLPSVNHYDGFQRVS